MSVMQLAELAQLMGGRLPGADARFDGVSTDTRTLQNGNLFVALHGPNFDGHDYLIMAAERGAAAAMIDRDVTAVLPAVRVDDTLRALGKLGQAWRRRCPARVVGITGSNGKTTLKEMTATILAQRGRVLATRGNLNNDIGVPLTLCRMRDEPYAVIEMGANHAGEIAYLTHLACPDVAVLNNAGRAHLEGFGSLDGVAHAKAEIIQGLPDDGVFVFNADDRYAGLWRELAAGFRQQTFGVEQPADVSSPRDDYQVVWDETGFEACFPVRCVDGEIEVRLRLAGEHNRMNALAAITAALAAGAQLQDAAALNGLRPVAGRLCPLTGTAGSRLIDDSYNANPDSVLAALHVLAAAPGRRTLVLGDLAELGDDAANLHAQIGQQAAACGVDRLFTVGAMSASAGQRFTAEHAHFDSQQALIDTLHAKLSDEDSVLIKGSRSARMDRVVTALRAEEVAC